MLRNSTILTTRLATALTVALLLAVAHPAAAATPPRSVDLAETVSIRLADLWQRVADRLGLAGEAKGLWAEIGLDIDTNGRTQPPPQELGNGNDGH